MISGNRIQFGFGSVCVGSDPFTREMRFQQIRPPQECGEKVLPGLVEYIGEPIILKFSYEDSMVFSKLLNSVEKKEMTEFEFKGYVFDFTKYNTESLKVCKNHLTGAMRLYLMAIAC